MPITPADAPPNKADPNEPIEPVEPVQQTEVDAHETQPDPHSLPWWHPEHLLHTDGLIVTTGLILVALIGLWGKRAHDRRCLRKKRPK